MANMFCPVNIDIPELTRHIQHVDGSLHSIDRRSNMPADSENTPMIKTLANIEAFSFVTADDIEEARQSLLLTPSEMASALDWSERKYKRTLEAARDTEFVSRDVALAVRALMEITDGRVPTLEIAEADENIFGGRTFDFLTAFLETEGGWSAEVAPPLLRLLVERTLLGAGTISYGEAATTLEERNLTHRVWPRTAYGRPLGYICRALLALSEETGKRIPLISVIVTKAEGDPSDGIDGLIAEYLKKIDAEDIRKKKLAMLRQDRSTLIRELQEEVSEYKHWPSVLRALLPQD